MNLINRGMLIALEGIDGSGKSTLVSNLARSLIGHGLTTVVTQRTWWDSCWQTAAHYITRADGALDSSCRIPPICC